MYVLISCSYKTCSWLSSDFYCIFHLKFELLSEMWCQDMNWQFCCVNSNVQKPFPTRLCKMRNHCSFCGVYAAHKLSTHSAACTPVSTTEGNQKSRRKRSSWDDSGSVQKMKKYKKEKEKEWKLYKANKLPHTKSWPIPNCTPSNSHFGNITP